MTSMPANGPLSMGSRQAEGDGSRTTGQRDFQTGNQARRTLRNRARDGIGVGVGELESIDMRPGEDVGAHRIPFLAGD